MDITVYLPDELGARAKEAEINMSRTLRDAVTDKLGRIEAVAELMEGATKHELSLEDDDGRAYTGRIVGTSIVYNERNDVEVFVTEDGRLIIYDGEGQAYYDHGQVAEADRGEVGEVLRNRLQDNDQYLEAMGELGWEAVVDL